MVSPTTDRRFGLAGNVAMKAPVDLATTTNITLSGEQSIQSVTTNESRVLVAGQTDPVDNGIYKTSTGAWIRDADANGVYDLKRGTLVFVTQGTHAGNLFRITSADTITIGTSEISFDGFDPNLAYDQETTYGAATLGYALQQTFTAKNAGADVTGDVAGALTASMAAAVLFGSTFEFTQGRTYQIAGSMTFPAGLRIKTNGCTFQDLNGTTSNTPFLTVESGVVMDDLIVSIPTGKRRDRVILINATAGVRIGKISISSVDQQANTSDTSDSAIRLVSSTDFDIGKIEVSNYDLAINVETCTRAKIGGVSITSYMRGFYMFDSLNVYVGRSHIRTASPNAALTAGHNGVLLSCNSDYAQRFVTLEDFTVENAGEHAIRIGGDKKHGGVFLTRPQVNAPGACGIKILGTDASAPTDYNDNIVITNALVEDCGTSLVASANRVGIMAEFVIGLQITGCIVRPKANTYCASYGIRINGCQKVDITSTIVEGAQFDNILIHATDGNIDGVVIAGSYSRSPARYGYNLLVDVGKTATGVNASGLTIQNPVLAGVNIGVGGTATGCSVAASITTSAASTALNVISDSASVHLDIVSGTTALSTSARNGSRWSNGVSLFYRSSATWVALV